MKATYVCLSFLLALSSAHAGCPNISGKYSVSAEPFGGQVSGPYGTTTIRAVSESKDSCTYEVRSRVSEFAFPLKSGTQELTLFSTNPGPDGYSFVLKETNEPNGSTPGTVMIGLDSITLSIPLEGCGGEGTSNEDCGVYLILE